jgi:hypothetical protein
MLPSSNISECIAGSKRIPTHPLTDEIRWPLHSSAQRKAKMSRVENRRSVSSAAALIASGWSEPSSRAGLSPAVVQRLSTAHV